MEWIRGNFYLSAEQSDNNARLVWNYLKQKGWSKEAVAGMLGNMVWESTVNPDIWESLVVDYSRGFGFTQWTPATKLFDWVGNTNPTPEQELDRINYEAENNIQWFENPEVSPVSPPISFTEFKTSKLDIRILATYFLYYYEHPSDPHQEQKRGDSAEHFYNLLEGESCKIYPKRLTDNGILNNPLWYSDNPFYQSGYGLPNCTCYAWGRFYELTGERPTLSTGNADQWFGNTADGYKRGQDPLLGSVICFGYTGSLTGQGGHVAIVEDVNWETGDIVTSNSAYGGAFFYTQTLKKSDNWTWTPDAYVQGFIYNPIDFCQNGETPTPTPTKLEPWLLKSIKRKRYYRRKLCY